MKLADNLWTAYPSTIRSAEKNDPDREAHTLSNLMVMGAAGENAQYEYQYQQSNKRAANPLLSIYLPSAAAGGSPFERMASN